MFEVKNLRSTQAPQRIDFEDLYKKYSQDVFRYAYSKVLDKTKAEDACSETFLRAIEKIHLYKSNDLHDAKPWLFTICRNYIYDQYKLKQNSFEHIEFIEEFYTPEDEESILDMVIEQDTIQKVKEYLTHCPETEREVVGLRVWQEMTFGEIAQITNKSEPAVKMIYKRSLTKIIDYCNKKQS